MTEYYKQFNYDSTYNVVKENNLVKETIDNSITKMNKHLGNLINYMYDKTDQSDNVIATIKSVRSLMSAELKEQLDKIDMKIKNYQEKDKASYRYDKIIKQQKICVAWLTSEIQKLQKRRMHLYSVNLKNGGLYIHNVDGQNIPLNPNWRKIAVNVSGGADSACLTSILANIIKENNLKITIDIITHTRVWEVRPWAGTVSSNVYKMLKNKWGEIIGERIENFIPSELEHGNVGNLKILDDRSPDQVIVAKFNDYLGVKNSYDAIYNATTKNPSVNSIIQDRMKNRDTDNIKTESLAMATKYGYWMMHPLIFTEKDWIIKQYYNMDLLDLLEVTRSCEGNQGNSSYLDGLDVFWYEEGKQVPECGECFWCKERTWAIQQYKDKNA